MIDQLESSNYHIKLVRHIISKYEPPVGNHAYPITIPLEALYPHIRHIVVGAINKSNPIQIIYHEYMISLPSHSIDIQ